MITVMEHIEHTFGKDNLRSTGVQYSDEVTTTDGNWTTVESIVFAPPKLGKLLEVEMGITWAQKSSSTAKYVRGRIQARNSSGTWVTILDDGTSPTAGNAYQETAADASSYTEYTYSGRVELVTNFDDFPFDVRVQVQREDSGENATGKVKNSSYIKIKHTTS